VGFQFGFSEIEMKYHLIAIAFLAGAIALYAAGSGGGGSALLVVGGVLEAVFWVRTLRRRRQQLPDA